MKPSVTREVRRLKYAATINDEALTDTVDPDFALQYVDIGNVDSEGRISGMTTYTFAKAPSRARRIVRDGDVIVSTVRTYLQAIASIQNPPENLIVSTGFAVVRPRPEVLDTAFCKYAIREPAFLAEVEMRSVGISYPAINASELGDIKFHLCPAYEQRAIARHLDAELGRLDELVTAKKELLGILAEKRQALISHAVTRGIDPKAPLRDSGIPWLGQVPVHWKLIPLRFAVTFLSGATPDKGNAQFWAGSIPWVSPKDMKRDEIADAEDHVSDEAVQNSALRLIPRDSILIVVRGMILAHSFPTAITTETVTINQDMKALVCKPWLAPRFLKVVLQGFTAWFVSAADQSAHGTKKLETESLGRFTIPMPPLPEQQGIVAHIAKETAKLDALRTATEESIALLKERRSALISTAVTGKLRVCAKSGVAEGSAKTV